MLPPGASRGAGVCGLLWPRLGCLFGFLPPPPNTPNNLLGNPAQPFLAPEQWQARVRPGGAERMLRQPRKRAFRRCPHRSQLKLHIACRETSGSLGRITVILREVMHGSNAGSSSARHSRPSAPEPTMSPAAPFCQAPPWPPHLQSSCQHPVFAHLFPSISVLSSFCQIQKKSLKVPNT